MVLVPAVFKVTPLVNVLVPETSAASDGRPAFTSLEVMWTVSLVLMTFQKSSTALTVIEKEVPEVSEVGVPVLPLAAPGDEVSPGTKSCSLVNAAAFTVTVALVLLVLLGSVTSLATRLRLAEAIFRVTGKVIVPFASAMLVVNVPPALVTFTTSVTFEIAFQKLSTAFTVTLNGTPAVCAVGVPVLPVVEPGAAVSPGSRICNLLKGNVATSNGALTSLASDPPLAWSCLAKPALLICKFV